MISIFRNNDVLNFALLLPYAVLLRLYSFINPQLYQIGSEDTIVTKWLFGMMDHALTQSIVATLIIFVQGLIINVLANNHRLHRLPTGLAGMVFIFLASSLREFQVLTPALIGLTFVLIAIFNVFNTYKRSNAAPNIFNACFSSAVSTLLYPPYALVIVALFIGFAMLRNFSWNERLQFLIGFLILFWIMGSALFYFDLLDWRWVNNITVSGTITDFWPGNTSLWWSGGIFLFLVLVSLFNYYNYMKKKVIDIRKKIDFFYWLLLSAFLSLIFFDILDYQHYLFLTISLSIFISMSILLIKNRALAELFHISAIIGIYYLHFG